MSFFQTTAPPVQKDKTAFALAETRMNVKLYKRQLERGKAQDQQMLEKSRAELERFSREGNKAAAMRSMKAMNTAQRNIDKADGDIQTYEILLMELQKSNNLQRSADLQGKINKAFSAMNSSISIAKVRGTAMSLEKNREMLNQKNQMVDETNDSLRDAIMADDDDNIAGDEGLEAQFEEYMQIQTNKEFLGSQSSASTTRQKSAIELRLEQLLPETLQDEDNNNNNNSKT